MSFQVVALKKYSIFKYLRGELEVLRVITFDPEVYGKNRSEILRPTEF